MTFIDLTYTLSSESLEFPGDPKTVLEHVPDSECNLSKLTTSLHTGTHIDSPYHYFENKEKIDEIDINNFIGKCSVIQCRDKTIKSAESFEEIIIINTNGFKDYGSCDYFINFPYLSFEFAERLIDENVKGVCIDRCSVDKIGENRIHKILLENNIWIAENIANTQLLKNKTYTGFFIPMKIQAEAAPVRAFVKL